MFYFKYSANLMKFYLILAGLLCFNSLPGQEEEDYVTYEQYYNNNLVEGGLQYFIPNSDFERKSERQALGGSFTYLRRLSDLGLFVGVTFASRKLDDYRIEFFAPDLDIETRVANSNLGLIARFYPSLYLSIFEFFAEGGLGMNTIRATSRDFDRIQQAYFNQFTNNIDRKLYFQGGGGFHIALDESWFLTAKAGTYFGSTIEFYSKRDELSNIEFSEDAFELTKAAYRATTISLSLSFIF